MPAPRLTKDMLVEVLDAILQQQFISGDGCILDRRKKAAVHIQGTKFTYIRIRNAIVDGIHLVLGLTMDKFIAYLSSKFKVPVEMLDEKIKSMTMQGMNPDIKTQFFMIISAMRDYWQDLASKKVLDELLSILGRITNREQDVSPGRVHELVSTKFNSTYSLLENIYVLREMGRLAGTTLDADRTWHELMDRLAAEIATALSKER